MRMRYLGELHPDMDSWGTRIGGYQFVIGYDRRLKVYSASWKNTKALGGPATFIGENIHSEAQLPYFNTMLEAEQACDGMYKQLRNPN